MDDKVITLSPSFSRYRLDVQFTGGFRLVPRALSLYHTLDADASVIGYVCDGDLDAVRFAFAKGTASPFLMDRRGWTLLHVCVSLQLKFFESANVPHLARCIQFSSRDLSIPIGEWCRRESG